jgi:hypothetical protein
VWGLLFQEDSWLLMSNIALKFLRKLSKKHEKDRKGLKECIKNHQNPLISIIFIHILCFDLGPFKAML